MNFDPLYYPYPSRRSVVFANRGMVATSQPLAAQAGLEILKKGGNAIDAAVAAAACLTVVEPVSNGIGGDAFAQVWTCGKLYGLNSSGPAPAAISLQALSKAGFKEMPPHGVCPVTVPGAPACWAELSRRFGMLPLTESMRPAIEYAERGFPVSPVVGDRWEAAFRTYAKKSEKEFTHWFGTFAPLGRAPGAGEVWRLPEQAKTLQTIAETEAEAFYRGDLAERIGDFFRRYSGYLTEKDLAGFRPEWVDPVKVDYKGYEVWEIPPNGHGIVAIMALNILKGLELRGRDDPESVHRLIEAVKLAFSDGLQHIADPRWMKVSVEDLLSEAYAEERRRSIGACALTPEAGKPHSGGTVYLATADGGRKHGFLHSEQLHGIRVGNGRSGHRYRPAQPGVLFFQRSRPRKQPRTGEKAVPHHHSRVSHKGREAGGAVRGHGGIHPTPGARHDGYEHRRFRAQPAGRAGRTPLPVDARKNGGSGSELSRARRRGTASQGS